MIFNARARFYNYIPFGFDQGYITYSTSIVPHRRKNQHQHLENHCACIDPASHCCICATTTWQLLLDLHSALTRLLR